MTQTASLNGWHDTDIPASYGKRYVSDEDGHVIAEVQPSTNAAHSRLIAAAPTMLGALRDIAGTCRDNLELGPNHCKGGLFDYFLDVARTAISQAEGWEK